MPIDKDISCSVNVISNSILKENAVTYYAYITGDLELDNIPTIKDIFVTFNADVPIVPVDYNAYIFGDLDIFKNNKYFDIDSSMILNKIFISDNDNTRSDIGCIINTNKIIQGKDLLCTVSLDKPYNFYNDLSGSLDIQLSNRITEIGCIVSVPYKFDTDISGDLVINTESLNPVEFDCKIDINGIHYENDGIYGSTSLIRRPYNDLCLSGDLEYNKSIDNTELFSYFYLEQFRHESSFQCQIKVEKKQYIYSIYSRIKVVPKVDIDIPVIIQVQNNQLFEIYGNVDLYNETIITDLSASLELPPYAYDTIDGTTNIDPVYTRRDIPVYMYAVTPINTDIECTFKAITVYTPSSKEFNARINVGNSINQDILFVTMNVLAALKHNNEFKCTIHVHNWRLPARIAIAVDPLWKYEPFVIRASLVTFLDRIYTKNDLSIIYGGNPRSDWDIEHFSSIFGVDSRKMIKSPLVYDSRNPKIMRESVERFIRNMFSFNEKDTHRVIDRVFLFVNKPLDHTHSIMSPIIDICKRYDISCVCIDSGGNFTEVSGPFVNSLRISNIHDKIVY